jgi:hypothetical protein
VDGAPARVDTGAASVTRRYDWGSLRADYRLDGDVLRVKLALSNDSDRPLANFRIRLAGLQDVSVPKGLFTRRGRLQSTVDRPLAIGFPIRGGGHVFACYETFVTPVRLGLPADAAPDARPVPLVVTGGVPEPEPGALTIPPKGNPQVAPGKTLKMTFAFRLAGPKTYRHVALAEFYRSYQEYHEPTLEWPDNRPIGATFLLAEFGKKPPRPGIEGTNPRRWFSPTMDTVDVFSPQGKGLLRKSMQQLARRTVSALKEMNAQGAILWNLEGGFHSTGFVGDPRMLPILNPELDEAMDDYFRIIREAGFRVGCTIRHPQLRYNAKRNQWSQGVGNVNPNSDPLRDGYDKFVPDHTPWWTGASRRRSPTPRNAGAARCSTTT